MRSARELSRCSGGGVGAHPARVPPVMRRRRSARQVRTQWLHGRFGLLARMIGSQAGMAALTPRVQRVVDLLELVPGRRYVDVGCGTANFAYLVGARAGLADA